MSASIADLRSGKILRPLQPVETLAVLVARIRVCAREAERAPLARELAQIADELVTIRETIMGVSGQSPGEQNYSRNSRSRAKNPRPGVRRCSICRTPLPLDMFTVTDAKSGKRRADCRTCYNERQRTRYVRAGFRIVTIEVLDGDACVGHPCPICGQPFEVGQHIQGDAIRHETCIQ